VEQKIEIFYEISQILIFCNEFVTKFGEFGVKFLGLGLVFVNFAAGNSKFFGAILRKWGEIWANLKRDGGNFWKFGAGFLEIL